MLTNFIYLSRTRHEVFMIVNIPDLLFGKEKIGKY